MINQHDDTYRNGLLEILEGGERRGDRTGVGTISKFGVRQVYDLKETYPALTTKKLAFLGVKSELIWFIEGSGDERRLAEILHGTRDPSKRTIWTDNAQAPYWLPKAQYEGDLGRVYGVQWRDWRVYKPMVTLTDDNDRIESKSIGEKQKSIDQLMVLVEGLKKDPHGRRHILSAWNPGELDNMALPPCHCFAQFYVHEDGHLDCLMYQRSNDFFLGGPFNIASYSMLTYMLAQVCGLKPGKLIHTSGDAHIYSNHIDQVNLQLSRESFAAPKLWLNPEIKDIRDFKMDDIKLVDYQSHAAIKAPMAV